MRPKHKVVLNYPIHDFMDKSTSLEHLKAEMSFNVY